VGAYEFGWFITQLEVHGKQQFGEHFVIHEKDHDIIRRLAVYFLADATLAARLGIDLSKGILLTGPVGCGKTCLMTLMQLVRKPERGFTFKPAREVSFEFIQRGYQVIQHYSRMSYNQAGPRTYCFDDLGAERALKYFGNECNVLAEIILSRYDHYIASDMLTHLTTNLSATEIEESYGPRVRSRMREMFNLISFDLAGDKRK
jgi:DNA replication protein DnaC